MSPLLALSPIRPLFGAIPKVMLDYRHRRTIWSMSTTDHRTTFTVGWPCTDWRVRASLSRSSRDGRITCEFRMMGSRGNLLN
ncbi:unnamed protein product [Nesidiocoris tenuis]|uniref:Uncharacterized protein n=1 Tax=Nesidiocoris tenuis TaxID=355587 RepID=A0A6H5GAK5_9HEMI|nr:unnamed protein product [Nesidiocoris tenuis]